MNIVRHSLIFILEAIGSLFARWCWLGTMYVSCENFVEGLVEEGLAAVDYYSAERSGNANELLRSLYVSEVWGVKG